MIEITVTRGAGDVQGETITEPILSGSTAAARARAIAELDTQGTDREMVSLEIAPPPLEALQPGALVEIQEVGRIWRGIIDSVSSEISAGQDEAGRLTLQRTCTITIEKQI